MTTKLATYLGIGALLALSSYLFYVTRGRFVIFLAFFLILWGIVIGIMKLLEKRFPVKEDEDEESQVD